MIDQGFPRSSYTPGEMCVAEFDFPRVSFPPGERCPEELEYIRLARSPVCAWIVTGSLLFGSPHRRVQGCFRSAVGLCYNSLGKLSQWTRPVEILPV